MQMSMGGLPTSRLSDSTPARITVSRTAGQSSSLARFHEIAATLLPAASQRSFASANNPKASLIPSSEAFLFSRPPRFTVA